MTFATSVGRDVNYRRNVREAYSGAVYSFLARNQAIVGFSFEALAELESSVARRGLRVQFTFLIPGCRAARFTLGYCISRFQREER